MSNLSYNFSWERANNQLVHITFSINENIQDVIELRLPSWRPGRYEISNFAKNIIHISACDSKGKLLEMSKTAKDIWLLKALGAKGVIIKYTFHAAILNAGSTWLDENQLYVNPVNCCLFISDRAEEPCTIELDIPDNYQVAIDKLSSSNNSKEFYFKNFDELADTPFIASAQLRHITFLTEGHTFHLWFQGIDTIPEDALTKDFRLFCSEQLQMMGKLPGKDYHFIYQILPDKFYHGVEHTHSTVCALGPAADIFNSPLYDEFLGVSSHELFHAWNVKTIRPEEMAPYNFSSENYSTLGWVYEGVTTWYGDVFLYRAGVFNFEQFIKTFDEKLKRHFTNYGRFNLSVAESSFDTWLDGYVQGAPNRKTSIYTEGSLITFLLDGRIRQFTNDKSSLDDLMKGLYEDAQKGKSYSRESLIKALDALAPLNHEEFFKTYIEGTSDLEPQLRVYLRRLGLDLVKSVVYSSFEHRFGLRIIQEGDYAEVQLVAPNSPAEFGGIRIGDKIIALDGTQFSLAFRQSGEMAKSVCLHVFSSGKLKEIKLFSKDAEWFMSRRIIILEEVTEQQRTAFYRWSKQKFPS